MWSQGVTMTQYTVGIRDLKAHLSSYLEKVQKGHVVLVTSHGKDVAQISLPKINVDVIERTKELQAAGLVAWSGKKLRDIPPPAINRGKKSASDIIVEMNNESLY
jgi:prevent-host-death family protein